MTPENIWRLVPPVFHRAQGSSFLLSSLNCFQGVLKISSCSSTLSDPCRGGRQVTIASASLQLTNLTSRFNTSLLYLFNIFSTASTWYLCQLQIGTCEEHWPETDLQQGICQLPQRRLTPVLLKLWTVNLRWGEFRVESQALCSRETAGTGLLDSQIFSGTDFLIPTLTFLHI